MVSACSGFFATGEDCARFEHEIIWHGLRNCLLGGGYRRIGTWKFVSFVAAAISTAWL
jgi:hypothetical protein